MSSQDSMFSPQENEPRQYNVDPREQPREQPSWQETPSYENQSPYQTGYGGTNMGWVGGEKLHVPPPPPPVPVRQWIIGAILVLIAASVLWTLISALLGSILFLLGVVIVIIAISQVSIRTIDVPPQIFNVTEHPRLVIHNPAGAIHIRRGTSNQVEIRAKKHVNGWFGTNDEGNIDFTNTGNTVNVTVRSQYKWSPLGGLRDVGLEITMPEQGDIQLEGSAGTIRIDGIRGQARVRTSAGTIHVEQAALEAQSLLATNAGTIHVQETALSGSVRLDTNAGTIHFDGTLDPEGDYRFNTNAGTIDVIVPATSSFTLAASTDLGTVSNQFGNTVVGPAPNPRLELRTNLGTINVRKG